MVSSVNFTKHLEELTAYISNYLKKKMQRKDHSNSFCMSCITLITKLEKDITKNKPQANNLDDCRCREIHRKI